MRAGVFSAGVTASNWIAGTPFLPLVLVDALGGTTAAFSFPGSSEEAREDTRLAELLLAAFAVERVARRCPDVLPVEVFFRALTRGRVLGATGVFGTANPFCALRAYALMLSRTSLTCRAVRSSRVTNSSWASPVDLMRASLTAHTGNGAPAILLPSLFECTTSFLPTIIPPMSGRRFSKGAFLLS